MTTSRTNTNADHKSRSVGRDEFIAERKYLIMKKGSSKTPTVLNKNRITDSEFPSFVSSPLHGELRKGSSGRKNLMVMKYDEKSLLNSKKSSSGVVYQLGLDVC